MIRRNNKHYNENTYKGAVMEPTENVEINVATKTATTSDLIKEAALKAVVSTIVGVAVGAIAEALLRKAVKRNLEAAKSPKSAVINTTATES